MSQLLTTVVNTMTVGAVLVVVMVAVQLVGVLWGVTPQSGPRDYILYKFVNHGVVEMGLCLVAMYATRQVRGGRLLSIRETCARCFFLFEFEEAATPLVDAMMTRERGV